MAAAAVAAAVLEAVVVLDTKARGSGGSNKGSVSCGVLVVVVEVVKSSKGE